ncbi:cytochrome C [Serratia marcescens]|uniref:c-type cytochrome n=1 Tax=Serratia marcescens TaxID=615 RepID=UPI000CA1061C|nr:cytochrome C [Serratia marcescens]
MLAAYAVGSSLLLFASQREPSIAVLDRSEVKASGCMSCHGPSGISQYAQWPNLAGQKSPYLISQLNAFREGKRKNGMMENVTKELNDTDIKELAEYFSKLPSESK